jgi:hypothetical protein
MACRYSTEAKLPTIDWRSTTAAHGYGRYLRGRKRPLRRYISDGGLSVEEQEMRKYLDS